MESDDASGLEITPWYQKVELMFETFDRFFGMSISTFLFMFPFSLNNQVFVYNTVAFTSAEEHREVLVVVQVPNDNPQLLHAYLEQF